MHAMHAMRGVHGHAARACVRVMHAHAGCASMHAMHDPWPLGKKCLPPKGGKNALGKFCPGGPLATLSSTIEHKVRNFLQNNPSNRITLFVLYAHG